MELSAILVRKRSNVLNLWFQHVARTYPPETTSFLSKDTDRFASPVSFAFRQGLEGIFDAIVETFDKEVLTSFLDEIVRIRAVQDFSPSNAVSFVFALKGIIRDEAARENGNIHPRELAEMEGRIDRLALLAFDIYMACREKIFEIKNRELRERAAIPTGYWSCGGGALDPDNKEGTNMERGES